MGCCVCCLISTEPMTSQQRCQVSQLNSLRGKQKWRDESSVVHKHYNLFPSCLLVLFSPVYVLNSHSLVKCTLKHFCIPIILRLSSSVLQDPPFHLRVTLLAFSEIMEGRNGLNFLLFALHLALELDNQSSICSFFGFGVLFQTLLGFWKNSISCSSIVGREKKSSVKLLKIQDSHNRRYCTKLPLERRQTLRLWLKIRLMSISCTRMLHLNRI